MIDLSGKTVVITGASQGIGASAAKIFASAGAKVTLTARNAKAINNLAAEINASGGTAIACPCDVSKWQDVKRAIESTVERFGGIDVLINNAGTVDPISLMAVADPQAWSQAIDTNLKGVFYGMRAALPVMQSGATIITVSSGAAHNALEGWSAYCASKAGAAMLTMAAHKEHAGRGIRVMGLSPGTVMTEMQIKIKASGINPVSQMDPSVHISPDDPAQALLWMCTSDADRYLGEEISLKDADIRKSIGLA